jgi:hypothetical protein
MSAEDISGYRGMMQLFTLTLLTASAVVFAHNDNHGHGGWGSHSEAWVPCFDNLITFGDR